MSRRSRRKAPGVKSSKLGIVAVLVLLLAVVGVGMVHTMVRNYLRSEGFRVLLSGKVNEAIQVDGNFAPFRWDGLAVDTDSYRAKGEGLVQELNVEGLHTEVGLGKIWDGVWQVQGSRVRQINVSIDTRAKDKVARPVVEQEPAIESPEKKGWMPDEFEMEAIEIAELNIQAQLEKGQASLRGTQVRVHPTWGHKAYDIEMEGGVIKLPADKAPPIRLKSASMRYKGDQVFLNELEGRIFSNGHVLAAGEFDFKREKYSLQGSVQGIKCEELLSANWAKKLSGVASTDFTMVDHGGKPRANGRLVIRNGVITALPILDTLAAYANTQRFRVLNISEATTDWKWRDGEIELTNLVLASEGLMRLEGKLVIRGEKLDGTFRLGLAPGTLASIPGAETDVFLPGEHGLLWTPLRITGTLDKPKEDLKNRLILAAGMRLFTIAPETGAKVLKFSGRALQDVQGDIIDSGVKAIEEGVKAIEGGTDIIQGAGGLLNELLGGGSKRDVKEPEEKEE